MISHEEYLQATRRGEEMRAKTPHAVSARYDRRIGRIVISLSTGLDIAFSPKDAQGLETATWQQLQGIEVEAGGFGIHFPTLNADLYAASARYKGLPPDFEKVGHLLPVLALVDQLPGVGNLLRGHFRLTSEFHAPALRGLHSGAGPFADEAALQLGQYADHLPHGPACRRLGVDLLGEGTEFDAALLEVVEHGDQVAQAAAQAVKFPDNERVAVLQCLEATEQGRALGRGS
jgi:hypothetical protein